jgi:peptidoglycan/LPS O-acetylase OafA/YrhL
MHHIRIGLDVNPVLDRLMHEARLGVQIFFMISGFVIYMSITTAKTIGDFWISRFIRLYPVYWLSIPIAIISFVLFGNQHISHQFNFILGNVTMLQPVFRTTELVGAYWTLYVELNFYLLISLILISKQFKHIERIILFGMTTTGALMLIYQLLNNSSSYYTRFFIVGRSLVPLVGHFQVFAAGMLFYLIYTKGINRMRLALLVMSFLLIAVTHEDGGKVHYAVGLNEHLVCCLAYYVLFILIIYNKASVLKTPIMVELGNISYALYLVHDSFGLSLSDYLALHIGHVYSISIGIVLSFTLAYLITHYVDIPLRHLLKKRLKPKLTVATVLKD